MLDDIAYVLRVGDQAVEPRTGVSNFCTERFSQANTTEAGAERDDVEPGVRAALQDALTTKSLSLLGERATPHLEISRQTQ
jgi:hypothetical protein